MINSGGPFGSLFTIDRKTGLSSFYGNLTVNAGYLTVSDSPTTGRIYFGTLNGTRYLNTDGQNFGFNGGGLIAQGDIYACRTLNSGAYFFGTDGTRVLYCDPGGQYVLQGGGLYVNGGSLAVSGGTFQLGGQTILAAGGYQNNMLDRAGNAAIIVSSAPDPTIYYRNSIHQFQSINGGAGYLTMNASGAQFGYGLTIQGNCSVAQNLGVTGNITATGGRIICQANAGPSITAYNISGGTSHGFWNSGSICSFGSADGNGNPATEYFRMQTNGGIFTAMYNGYKPGGGLWADLSDERIKNVLGNYESGLDAIMALQPVRFTFKGNDTRELPSTSRAGLPDDPELKLVPTVPYPNSMHFNAADKAIEYIGLVAQAAEVVMPELVTKSEGFIDGIAVTDLRDIDTTPLIYALINAVKELKAEVEALKAVR
jgi:hypothetical protein